MPGPGLGCGLQNTVEVAVDAPDQGVGQVSGLGQRPGAGHDLRRRIGRLHRGDEQEQQQAGPPHREKGLHG